MKKKILVIALAMAVMLMGAGYAYWTDQISVNNLVGTGEFDVNIVKVTDGGGDRNPGAATTNWEKYMRVDTNWDGQPTKSLSAEISNLYPGSVAHLSFDIENNGSLPAVLDCINVDYDALTGSALIVDKIYYRVDYKIVEDGVQVGTPKHYIDGVGLATFKEELNSLLAGIVLEPGQMLIVGDPVDENGQDLENKYTFELPSTIDNEDGVENSAFKLNFTMNWKQHNDPTDYSVQAPEA